MHSAVSVAHSDTEPFSLSSDHAAALQFVQSPSQHENFLFKLNPMQLRERSIWLLNTSITQQESHLVSATPCWSISPHPTSLSFSWVSRNCRGYGSQPLERSVLRLLRGWSSGDPWKDLPDRTGQPERSYQCYIVSPVHNINFCVSVVIIEMFLWL